MSAGKVNQHHRDGRVTYPLELEYVGKGGPQPFVVYTSKDDEAWLDIKEVFAACC
jgi:hypothetical protein